MPRGIPSTASGCQGKRKGKGCDNDRFEGQEGVLGCKEGGGGTREVLGCSMFWGEGFGVWGVLGCREGYWDARGGVGVQGGIWGTGRGFWGALWFNEGILGCKGWAGVQEGVLGCSKERFWGARGGFWGAPWSGEGVLGEGGVLGCRGALRCSGKGVWGYRGFGVLWEGIWGYRGDLGCSPPPPQHSRCLGRPPNPFPSPLQAP